MQPEYLEPKDVAKRLGFHVRTIHRKLKANPPELPGILVGRNWRIPAEALKHSFIPNTAPAHIRKKAKELHGVPVKLPDGYAIMSVHGQLLAQQKQSGD